MWWNKQRALRAQFAVILAFDVPVTKEASELAESTGVRIFTADIIYHLFDQFTAYLAQVCGLSRLCIAPKKPGGRAH